MVVDTISDFLVSNNYAKKKFDLNIENHSIYDYFNNNQKKFDVIFMFDVLEHLADPSLQIDNFHEIMGPNSIGLFNWYFYKGENNEYPFHVDDEEIVEQFFKTLQSKFVEVFHPILITTRSYKKN